MLGKWAWGVRRPASAKLRRLGVAAGSLLVGAALLGSLTACAPDPPAPQSSERGTKTPSGSSTPKPSAKPSAKPGASAGDSSAKPAPVDDLAGKGGTSTGESWPEQNDPAVEQKDAQLPASFPSERFVVPPGATVDDAGERSATDWFVVLRAANQAEADQLWQSIIAESGFAATEVTASADGGISALLSSASTTAVAVTIPQSDGSVLLSYDVTAE
ncbi:hypothetical protein EDF60_1285 [Leucobacter luti]|uniref:hypothetical protein n=1 Tax=Leucobacter luti TaxID=340320 RepID=UPI001049298A|nr:hypothetical protein [Leucobacter luti]MCW2287798.1 hypothetical protein [Leucobacter luti]TCK46039.1 hypothetical protein EDF60_1285 [Leucobacter luti]